MNGYKIVNEAINSRLARGAVGATIGAAGGGGLTYAGMKMGGYKRMMAGLKQALDTETDPEAKAGIQARYDKFKKMGKERYSRRAGMGAAMGGAVTGGTIGALRP